MGLDMHLMASKKMPREQAAVMMKADPKSFRKWFNEWDENAAEVPLVADAAYWRKANAIHNWFVKNVQGGVDDCHDYPVTAEQLLELRNKCAAILEGANREEHDIVPVDGFFFGSTSDDQAYREDLEDTVRQIDEVLTEWGGWDFKYYSSW